MINLRQLVSHFGWRFCLAGKANAAEAVLQRKIDSHRRRFSAGGGFDTYARAIIAPREQADPRDRCRGRHEGKPTQQALRSRKLRRLEVGITTACSLGQGLRLFGHRGCRSSAERRSNSVGDATKAWFSRDLTKSELIVEHSKLAKPGQRACNRDFRRRMLTGKVFYKIESCRSSSVTG